MVGLLHYLDFSVWFMDPRSCLHLVVTHFHIGCTNAVTSGLLVMAARVLYDT